MKRMNLMIDEEALKAAMLETGEFKASAVVNKALAEVTRVLRVRKGIKAISGTGAWEGDLKQMRAPRFDYPIDAPKPTGKKIAAKTVTNSQPKKTRGKSRSSR